MNIHDQTIIDYARELRYIQFYPTVRCNMRCNFCFNSDVRSDLPDISHRDFGILLEKLKNETSVTAIDIMGGEPFLHEEIGDMVKISISAGFTVNISTNGTMPDKIRSIRHINSKLNLGISINTYEQLKMAEGLIRELMPIVKSVYSPDLDWDMVHYLGSLPVRGYYILYPDELKRGESKCFTGFEGFYTEMSFGDSPFSGMVYCYGFIPDIECYPLLDKLRCPAGSIKIGIMPDGAVYPCNLFFGLEEFCLGNILKEPIKKILTDERLSFFREFNGNNCPQKDCSLFTRCHGGCPAHSYIHYGSLEAPEPRCMEGKGLGYR